ncbi:MAG: sel1 repeat family protein [Myxococcales bacterium]|nr:sel1 repeat family protein [Myxococcales bacterium]
MTMATIWTIWKRRVATPKVLTIVLCLAFFSGCAQQGYFKSASQSIENKDYDSAVTYLELGAQKGDRRCAYLLGSMLISGERVDPDLVEGVLWMGEAAEAELPIAQAYLGTLYASGEGVEKNLTTAAEWYRKAAEYGNPLGQVALGAAVFYGVGVPADTVEGYVWTKLAAKQGVLKAVSNLFEMTDALTEDERGRADKRVARFQPKENKGGDSDFASNRGNKGRRSTFSTRGARATAGSIR